MLLFTEKHGREHDHAPISLLIIACDTWIYTNTVQTPYLLQLDGYSTEHT